MQVREVNGVKYIYIYSSNDSKGREIKAYVNETDYKAITKDKSNVAKNTPNLL